MFLTKMRLKRLYGMLALGLLVALAPAAIANAVCNPSAQSCSSSYQVTESFFGAGGGYSCSGQYCANQSSGELTVGNTGSTNYQAQAGFNTDRAPYIEFIVNTAGVDVGVLDSGQTHVGTATFQVKSYLAEGYQVTTSAVGPTSDSHTLASPSSPTASAAGTEQFGMNVVANTCPGTIVGSGLGSCPDTGGTPGALGAAPSQNPDSTFSFGYAATGYNTANAYKYTNGDIIAKSDSSSGVTLYTISYLFNISNVTPAGTYTMNQSLVVTSTF